MVDFSKIPLEAGIPILIFALFFGCCIISNFVYFDFAPASGTATGYIAYQEKGGIFQLDSVCWRDNQYSECETFDPRGVSYEPGKYKMTYKCDTLVWAWQHPSECYIVNATKIGEIS